MRFQKVHSRLWTDPQFRAWSRDARDAALYLLTCPHRNTEGLFRLPLPLAAYDLGWDTQTTSAAFDELADAEFIHIDPAADLIWIPDALEWDPPANGNQVIGAVRVLAELPQSHLLEAFLAHASRVAPKLAEALADTLGWSLRSPSEAPSKPLRSPSGAHPDPPSPSPSPSPSPTTTTRGDTQDPPDPSRRGGGPDDPPTASDPEPLDDHGDPEAHAVVAEALEHLGLDRPDPPTRGETRTVRRALDLGHDPASLAAKAWQAQGPDVRDLRRWLVGTWAGIADNGPPTDQAGRPQPTPADQERRSLEAAARVLCRDVMADPDDPIAWERAMSIVACEPMTAEALRQQWLKEAIETMGATS